MKKQTTKHNIINALFASGGCAPILKLLDGRRITVKSILREDGSGTSFMVEGHLEGPLGLSYGNGMEWHHVTTID
jgi:hypothetical protein